MGGCGAGRSGPVRPASSDASSMWVLPPGPPEIGQRSRARLASQGWRAWFAFDSCARRRASEGRCSRSAHPAVIHQKMRERNKHVSLVSFHPLDSCFGVDIIACVEYLTPLRRTSTFNGCGAIDWMPHNSRFLFNQAGGTFGRRVSHLFSY